MPRAREAVHRFLDLAAIRAEDGEEEEEEDDEEEEEIGEDVEEDEAGQDEGEEIDRVDEDKDEGERDMPWGTGRTSALALPHALLGSSGLYARKPQIWVFCPAKQSG
ncbi:hypothetical protein BC834DRAFT_1044511 [Gloeopeniophorella convolvens]|nr:hypothetical protein BC834DRAFT_1044511 [Gloeopeniophorella convolvens]